jgi:intein/homing endonuclease
MRNFSFKKRAYLAGFLDGDGSIYVRLKKNPDYKYGYQIAPYIILFQSKKSKLKFQKICSLIKLGYIRERKDGILEYTINRVDNILKFVDIVKPFAILKKEQLELIKKILKKKQKIKTKKDFKEIVKLINSFKELNYSKKRKIRILTP